MSSLQPKYRHVFKLTDGETIICADRDAIRTIDKRADGAEPETVWEITLPSGIVRRVWPNELASWDVEDV